MRRYRSTAVAVLALWLVGLVLALAVEWFLYPSFLERPLRIVYNLSYCASAPARWQLAGYFGRMPNGERIVYLTFVYFFTALLWVGLWQFLKYAWRRHRLRRPSPRAEMTRRAFLATATVGVCTVAYGSVVSPEELAVRRYRLPIRGLPRPLDGLTLVQLSDTHYGMFTPLRFVEAAVDAANALKPDLFILTGDYVYALPEGHDGAFHVYGRLKPRYGNLAVFGNHDNYYGNAACTRAFQAEGIRCIENGRVFLSADGWRRDPDPDCLCIGGVGDLKTDRVLFGAALAGVSDEMPRIVLAHNPDSEAAVPPGCRVDLLIARHTHGGQISLPIIGSAVSMSRYMGKYLGGLCQGPGFPILVSRGIGMVVLPIRLGVPPELSHITLVCV